MDYTIGEFSKLAELSSYTLRYYEKEGLLGVSRNSSGRRFYTEADVNWIAFIKKLKETGMPLKEIKEYARLRYQGDATMPERLNILEKHRRFVLEEKTKWEINLANLDTKIKFYEDKLSELSKNPF